MTPDLLALSRAYMALPGAPEVRGAGGMYVSAAVTYFRDSEGILWADAAGPDAYRYDWLPSLTDDATGGALLGMLPTSRTVDMDHGFVSIVVFTGAGRAGGSGATLAEAVARVAVALGRAR
jgi:hypothetical protein